MSLSAREFRKEHSRRAGLAASTVVARQIEEASAHELSIRTALSPMGKIKEVNVMHVDGDRQSWALVTYADEACAVRSTSRSQRKAYGCVVALPWEISIVPVVEMLHMQMQFMPSPFDGDGTRIELMRETFDKGVSPMTLYKWRISPDSLAKEQYEESESRLLQVEALNAGKTVKQIVTPSAEEQAEISARRKKQVERRRQVLGYHAQADESDGAKNLGGDALNRLVANIGRAAKVQKAWTVPPVPPSTSELKAERDRLKVAGDSLRTLSTLKPKPPTLPPPKPKKRRLVLHLPNQVQAPSWPQSTALGRSNPRMIFDVPHRNPYLTTQTDQASERAKVRAKWRSAIQSNVETIVGWRHDGDDLVVTDPTIEQLLYLCGVTESVVSGTASGRKGPSRASSPDRTSTAVAEKPELRVKLSLLKARTVFQKLVLYAIDHPRLKLILDVLRKVSQHQIEEGPWVAKLRERTAEIKMNCPDGRPSLRAARSSSPGRGSQQSKTCADSDSGLLHELPDLNVTVSELLEKGEADSALHLIDNWLERHQEAGGHPPDRRRTPGPAFQLLAHRSKALLTMGEYARSNHDAAKLIAIRPSNPRPHVMLAAAHIDRSDNEHGGYLRAAECLLDATGISPAAVHPQSLQIAYSGVRQDRHYRNEIATNVHTGFPSQDFIRSVMDTVQDMTKPEKEVKKVRKQYDWISVDVSDLVSQQHRIRVCMLKMANDDDGVTKSEMNELLRNMTAEQLPKLMINQVRAMCLDGEIDEHDKYMLEDLAPPDKFDNLRGLVELLESMEQKILTIFRHYCYVISAGYSGVNQRSDAVSPAQFTLFVRDCKMLEGQHAISKSAVDQIFLRAMFLRGGPDGLGGRSEKKQEEIGRPRNKTQMASLGTKKTSSSHTLGSDGTQRALELYEFTGAMVRLANQRYPNMIGKGLAAKFDRFTDEVLDRMEAGGVHNLEELMASKDISRVLTAYNAKLMRIFDVFAKDDHSDGSVLASKISKNIRSAADHSINMHEFEQFAMDAGLIHAMAKPSKLGMKDSGSKELHMKTRRDGTPFLLTRQHLHEVFVEVNLDDDLYVDEDAENEADEIVYEEFKECLVLLSQLQLVTKAAETVLPPPKTFAAEEVAVELDILLKGALTELALTRADLRGIDRVRGEDTSLDNDGGGKEDFSFYIHAQVPTTQGRRAGGAAWTKLPWKRPPSVRLRPPSKLRGSAVRSSGGSVSPKAARPITQRELKLHTVPALEKLARTNKAISNENVDAVMHDLASRKERLIELLVEAAAINFRAAYIAEHGVEPPVDLDQGHTDQKSNGKTTKKKKKKKKKV